MIFLDESELQDNDQNEEHSQNFDRNEDVSSVPFGIYDEIEKKKMDEVNNDIQKGFNSWGNGKNTTITERETLGAKWEFNNGKDFSSCSC